MKPLATVARAGRTLLIGIVGCYVVAGVVASHRAYFPVRAVTIRVSEDVLRPGGRVSVDCVTSGRGPVSIRIDALQGGRLELVAADSVPAQRWAYWDPRRVSHTTEVTLPDAFAERFQPGVITLRATVTGAPAWLRKPPPLVEEVRVPFRTGHEADRVE